MPQQTLELAKQLIEEKQYDKARSLLMKVADNPTARKWLDRLDEIAPTASPTSNGMDAIDPSQGWSYTALEVKKSYGIQYRVNGNAMSDWKDQPIYYALNELGKEGWELVSFDTKEETTVYILKRPGAVTENKKTAVWDQ